MSKSKKVYAIGVQPIQISRDQKLSIIMEIEPEVEIYRNFLAGNHYLNRSLSYPYTCTSNNISSIKTWKTIRGVEDFYTKIISKYKYMYESSKITNEDGSIDTIYYLSENNFQNGVDSSGTKISYKIIEVTDLWNEYIDNEIKKEDLIYHKKIKNLISKKI